MKLNLGCGSQVPDGWINVDYALGARFMKIPFFSSINKRLKIFNLDWNERIFLHDLTKQLPWQDSSVDVVYSSHALEHFSKEDGRKLLAECYRVLRKNGIIRIVVPDLQNDVKKYLDGTTKADDFICNLGVLYGGDNHTLKKKLAPFFQFPHKCMYDNSRLVEILKEIGFDSSIKEPFESSIEDVRAIEMEDRTKNSVIVEGTKR